MSVWNPKANAMFLRAVEMPSPDERAAYLDEVCAGDPALRAEVEQLLKAHQEAGNFLERPLLGDQQTEDLLGSTDGDDQPDPPEPSSEPISLDFLEPSDVPDSLGRLGQYEVREVIGRGGMGVVLKANDPKLNRIVAVKVLAPELAANPTARKRFLREAQAAAAVSHQHVVTIHAVEEDHVALPGDGVHRRPVAAREDRPPGTAPTRRRSSASASRSPPGWPPPTGRD